MRRPSRFALALAGVAAVGLAVRVGYLLALDGRHQVEGDAFYYHHQANLLADGRGFLDPYRLAWLGDDGPTAYHPPLFPLLLAGLSLFGGTSVLSHKLLSCLLGAATVAVVGLLGRDLAGSRAGLVAAGLAATYPNLWTSDALLMAETPYALAVALTGLAAYRLWKAPSPWRAVSLGAVVATGALVRSEGGLLLPLVALPLAARARGVDGPARLRLVLLTVGTALAVVSPWVARNLARFDRPVLLSSNGGATLAAANCDEVYHGPLVGYFSLRCWDALPRGDDSEIEAFWRRRGLAYARDHLDRLPQVVAARVGRVWDVFRPAQNRDLDAFEGRSRRASWMGLVAYAVLAPIAVAGAVVLRRRAPLWPLAALAVLVTVVAALSYGNTRFRISAEVALVVLAAVALDAVVPGGSSGRSSGRCSGGSSTSTLGPAQGGAEDQPLVVHR